MPKHTDDRLADTAPVSVKDASTSAPTHAPANAAMDAGPARAEAISRKYAALTPGQRRQFREKARAQGIDTARLPIRALNDASHRAQGYPLSPAQHRLWFLYKFDRTDPSYHLSRALRLNGPLDPAVLRRAAVALVARHGALRARFVEHRGEPSQMIDAGVPGDGDAGGSAAAVDWRELSLADAAGLHDTLRALAREPFDLETGPMLRVAVVRLPEEGQHALLIATHHIVSDGWSQALMLRELATLYRAALRDGAAGAAADIVPPLAPLTLHAADVAAWDEEWRPAPRRAAGAPGAVAHDPHLAYWIDRLSGSPPALALPFDRPRQAVRGVDGGRCRLALDERVTADVRALARARRTTPFTILLAGYLILLYRYGGQTDLRVGVPSSGRDRVETEALVGYFVNTLVIDARLDGALRVDALLTALHARVLDAQAHRHVPFGAVLDALRVPREPGVAPLFQVMFNLEQAGGGTAELFPGVVAASEEGGTDTARFDLVLNVVDHGETLALLFHYAADVFDRATVARMAHDYVAVVSALAAPSRAPHARVGDLPLRSVPAAPSPTRYPFASLPQALRERARASGMALAVRCEAASMTYAALDAWSDDVCRRLRGQGVEAESRVGLCVARGPAMIAALLGIVKSGAAFVPLDPTYPTQRLTQMIDDAAIREVVADPASAAAMRAVLGACVVVDVGDVDDVGDAVDVGDGDGGAPGRSAPGTASPALHPEQLAYILFTSGSTGRPKGVAVSHGALWTHLQDFLATYDITSADTVLHSSTINFDVALHEILPALLRGARVEMRGEQPWDLQSLSERLVSREVSFARIPTALWQQWHRGAPARERLSLRQVTVGGEALPGDALARWRAGPLADIRLDNLYGPTETTVAALYRETCAADTRDTTVSIGVPYPGRSARVVDAFGDDAPRGGLGELCIGGVTLARGYWNRPGLTASLFVPDPHGAPGARMYRSGDLCRVRADGAVDFLGRLDQQVKLRGQRIELGEIEAALREAGKAHGLPDAAVIVTGAGEQQRLAGYVAGPAGAGMDADGRAALRGALQAALRHRLPAYMVPTTLGVLERLPTMPNGKLDRAALPAPEAVTRERVAPGDALEAALLSIWSAVLGRDDLGVTDNFFEAGGDSIQSLQIIARAREAGWVLTPRQVFDHPSIAQLAGQARALAPAGGASARTAAAAREAAEDASTAPFPLTPIQQAFFARYPHGESHWNQSVLLKVDGALDDDAFARVVQALRARHDALRLRFTRDADGWLQHVTPAAQAEPGLVRRQTLSSLDELDAAGQAIQASLDIRHGPIWRVGHFDIARPHGPAEVRLLFVAHHLVVDAVSWRVLLDEVQTAYAQAARGDAIAWPAPSTSWRRWLHRLRDYARLPERLAEVPWWQGALAGGAAEAAATRAPLFPALRSDGAPQRTLRTRLSPAQTALLVASAPRAYRMRVDEVLLAALASAVGRVVDGPHGNDPSDAVRAAADRRPRPRILIELEGHGREDVIDDVDLSRTVGWFTTQYPVMLPCVRDAARALRAVKAVLATVPARGLHWGLLAHLADPTSARLLAALPTPEISFNYLGRFDRTFREDTAAPPPRAGDGVEDVGDLDATLPIAADDAGRAVGAGEAADRTGSDVRFAFAGEAAGEAMPASTLAPDRALDLNAWIGGEGLSIDWGYAPQFVSPRMAQDIVAVFEATLATMLDHLRQVAGAGTAMSPPLVAPGAAALPAASPGWWDAARDDPAAAMWVARAGFEAGLPVPPPAMAPASASESGFAPVSASVPDIGAAARDDAPAPPPRWVRPLNGLGAPLTLWCFHPGYGMVGEYRTLALALHGSVTVLGVQAPALQGEPWDGPSLDALAAHYVAALRRQQPQGPYALLGWSFGGRLAVAAAARLIAQDQQVVFVGIVDTATHYTRERPDERRAASADEAHDEGRGDAQRLAALVADPTPSLLRAAFDADAVHTRLLAGHVLPHLPIDLDVWRASQRPDDPTRMMAWQSHTRGRVTTRTVAATHSSIVHHPAFVAQLVERLAMIRPDDAPSGRAPQ